MITIILMTFIRGFRWDGYTQIIEKMLEGAEVRLNVDYLKEKENLRPLGKKVVYTWTCRCIF